MKTFLKYALFTVVAGVMLHVAIEKAAIAGCKQGVFVIMDAFMQGIDNSPTFDAASEKLCRATLSKRGE